MARGVPTSEVTIAEFRAHYLYSGNASASARAMGRDADGNDVVSERLGREIAKGLEEEPSFAEERRQLQAHALQRLVQMRIRVAEKAAERFEDDLPMPEVGEGAIVTIVDKRADYGKLVLEAEKNAQHLARIEAERDGTIQTEREVVIRVESFSGAKRADAAEPETSGEAP